MVRCANKTIYNFQIFLLFAIEMAVLSVFSQKKGLGPLGVNLDPKLVFVCCIFLCDGAHIYNMIANFELSSAQTVERICNHF